MIKIKEDFDEVIRYSQDIQNPQTDRLFEIWEKKKASFIESFGGLIYEYPEKVIFELGEKEKHDRVIQFAGEVYSKWGYYNLAKFIESQEEGFYKNITVEEALGYDGKLIKKGTKLVKAFKHFINSSDRSLADIQNEASRIIQENKIEGTLCLSVHPLDFLSLSENTYNWRSCHSLDGEYRAGNLSYMMDDCTFICYLKGADDVELSNFGPNVKWNSKKWRVLLYESADRNLIMAGRQYPFESSVGLDFVLKKVLPKVGMCQNGWTGWNKELIKSFNLKEDNITVNFSSGYLPIGDKLLAVNKLVKDAVGSCHYNDLLYSSCYSPWYTFATGPWSPITNSFSTFLDVGELTYCLHCGKEAISKGASTMMCDECTLKYGTEENDMVTHCDCCGRRVFVDDAYLIDDEYVCPECLKQYYQQCDSCGEYYHIDFLKYSHKTGKYLCDYCYDEEEE